MVHKDAGKYRSEIKRQRSRLRIDMQETNFCTWYAKTLTILGWIPEITPLQQNFIDVGRSNVSVADKVKQARGILLAVIEIIDCSLFGTATETKIFGTVAETARPVTSFRDIVVAQNMTNTQTLTQPINVDLDMLLKRVDDAQGISGENKEEAKSIVKTIWNHITSGTMDSLKWLNFATRLANLGFEWQEILSGL